MSHRREIVRSFTSLVGVTVVLGMFVGLAGLVVGTAFLELSEREVSVEPATPLAHQVDREATDDAMTAAVVVHRGPAVHLQMPAVVPRVGSRQVRVTVSWQGAVAVDEIGREFVEVSFASDDPRIYVVPQSVMVAREELRHTRFFVAARPDLPCGEVLDGQLHISVRGLAPAAEPVVGQAPLPRLDCETEPPIAPASVHVTDPVCGPDHADQAQRLVDGKSLDPRICEDERWYDGRWREPRVAPAPVPGRRDRPDRTEPEAADDEATDPPDDSATDEETDDVPEAETDEGDETGGDETGGDETGGDDAGGDETGGDETGGDDAGADNSGGSDTGGDDAGSNSGSGGSGPEAETTGDTDGDTSGEATG